MARGNPQRALDNAEDLRGLARLPQYVRYAAFFGQGESFALQVIGGIEDHRPARQLRVLAQPADELIAIHCGHEYIADNEVRLFAGGDRQTLHAVRRLKHAVPVVTEQCCKNVAV